MKKRGRPPTSDLLTPREIEVLSLLQRGYSNREIADELGISLAGAKFHVSEIISRLGVSTREEAATWQPRKHFFLLPFIEWLRQARMPAPNLLAASALIVASVLTVAGFAAAISGQKQRAPISVETSLSTPPAVGRGENVSVSVIVGRLIGVEQGQLTIEDEATGTRRTVSYNDRTQVTRLTGYSPVTDNDVSRLRPGDELHVWPLFGISPTIAGQIGANWVKVIEVLIVDQNDAYLTGRVNEAIPGSASPVWSSTERRVIQLPGATDISGTRHVSEYRAGERLMIHAYVADDGSIVPVVN